MVDVVDSMTRSRMMAGIKGKDTQPEIVLRKALFKRGFRYRLHGKGIPGKPDIVLRKYNAVIFVNGCFWHGHDCNLFKWPTTRKDFWKEKIEGTRVRDKKKINECHDMGLRTLVVWECALKGKEKLPFDALIQKVVDWLHSNEHFGVVRGA